MLVIRVSNIHPWVKEKKLHHTFSTFGPIEDIEIISDDEDDQQQTGLICFRNAADALEAEKCFNGASTDIGSPLEVNVVSQMNRSPKKLETPSQSRENLRFPHKLEKNMVHSDDQNTLIFVKNFKDMLDENQLRSLFEKFGRVVSVSIKRENGKSKGYGFVDFAEHSSATEAIKHMDGKEIREKRITVAYAQKKEDREKQLSGCLAMSQPKEIDKNNVLYVRNLPKSTTEQDLISLFEVYGKICSVDLKTKDNSSTSVGFVCFDNSENAEEALKSMHGRIIQSRSLEVLKKNNKVSKSKYTPKPAKQYSRNAIGHFFEFYGDGSGK